MTVNANLRNVLIIIGLAAVVAIVPGGGTAAGVIIQAVSLAFLASIVWVASLMYREHRIALYSLGDRRRGALYAAVGVLAVTLSATSQLWGSNGGSVAWLALVGASVYVGVSVILAARRY